VKLLFRNALRNCFKLSTLSQPSGKATAIAEAIEPRLLFSADLTAPVLAGTSTTDVVQQQSVQAPAIQITPSQLFVVDLRIANVEQLLLGLEAQQVDARARGEQFDILLLEASDDGITKIGDALSERGTTSALHLLGHGSDAMMLLGNTWMDDITLRSRAADYSAWSQNLSSDADVLLYGCDFAISDGGKFTAQSLSQLTGADVAASTDTTASFGIAGNWNLEFQNGIIEASTQSLKDAASQVNWQGRLATYVVTTANDSGAGSLRDAIDQANSSADPDDITFNISGAGIHTISLMSALPPIYDKVTVDATTQSGFTNQPLIELNGAATVLADGIQLSLGSSGSRVQGLIINRFGGVGINVASNNNTIVGNYIGTSSDGSVARANAGMGIYIGNSSGNVIGGAIAAQRNVISGNGGTGVFIDGLGSVSNSVLGNYIGTTANGLAGLANLAEGLIVTGNASYNSIGGFNAGEGNVISGNAGNGIGLYNTHHNIVRGNVIGLNAIGSTAIANTLSGVAVTNSSTDRIGGAGFGEGNTISGNLQNGIFVDASAGLIISGNFVGRNTSNNANIGNGGSGIVLTGNTTNTLIGGISAAAANVIAGNTTGILTSPNTTAGNRFLGNQIFGHTNLGIDLNADDVTLNDPLDADNGSNDLQNFPNLYTAHSANGDLVINGEINSGASSNYRIEFFSSPLGNSYGYGEGVTYLGVVTASTNASGYGYFSATLTGVTLPADRRVTSTATLDLGSGNYGSTSEFSRNIITTAGTPGVTIAPPTTAITTEAGSIAVFSVVLDSQPTSDVTINLSVSDATEGSVAISSLTFTPLNWNVAQVVSVTGVDDFLLDGAVGYSVITSAAISADSAYNGLAVDDVAFTTSDDDAYNTAVVDTTSDLADGDVSSIAALYANRGADGKISFREAIFAANNTPTPSGTVNHIHFTIQDPLMAGEHVITVGSSLPIISRAVVIDASTDSDWLLNGSRPVVVLDGNDLSASGIEFSATGGGSTVRGFIIRNFAGNAVLLTYGANGITIAGNYIGSLNAFGADAGFALSNSFSGIYVDSSNNIIGGTSATDRNVISGNLAAGILIHASSGNVIQNNYIGTVASGLSLVGGSAGNGVGLYAGSTNNRIGTVGYGNVIAGNNNGVSIHDAGSNLNRVQGNYIGTDVSGSLNLGNVQEGVEVLFGAANNLIGGTNAGEGNTIFNNGSVTWAGVSIEDTSSGNAILGNRISNSGAIGIQLGWASFAPLPNDLNDSDDGANGNQNYPVLISAISNAGNTFINGRLNSSPNQSFRIEFFSSPSSDALGFGEARNYLGATFVTTDPAGNALISTLLPGVSVQAGYVVSSTATIDLGSGNYSSTSEFSQNVTVSAVAPGVTVTQPTSNLTAEYGGTVQFSLVLDTAPTQNVTINLTVSDTTEGAIELSSITFTPLNWNVAQFVTVTGLNDTLLDGDVNYSVITSATISADPAYSDLTVADIALVTPDNDSFNAVVVNTVNDIADGDTSSIAALYANRGSDGKISLREAILAANSSVNPPFTPDRIHFDIPDGLASGRHTINLISALPLITDAVEIDGTTEPDYPLGPVVRINNSGPVSNGFTFAAGSAGSTLKGLMITSFSSAGVLLDVGSDSTSISRNYIGTDGLSAFGNGNGIIVRSDINFIGDAGAGNLISGNLQNGIQFQSGANSNFVIGNKVGTNAMGTSALANAVDGIQILVGADNNNIGTAATGGGNIVSGNLRYGVSVISAQGTVIKNNFIGLSANGNGAVANSVHGIALQAGATGTVVGGVTAADRNVVSGNSLHGIQIGGPTTINNLVIGNYIGTNADATASVGNGWSGISIDGNSKNNTVGGSGAGEGNVIAGGLGNGVTFSSSGTTGNRLLGNFIGTNRLGSTSLGNALVGVEAVTNAGANQIGGAAAGEGNTIAFSGLQGVSITSGTGISILSNQIYANAGLGIDLNDDGVTANDLVFGDADAGPNNLLNFPVIFSAEIVAGGYVNVGFTVDVPQLNNYRVEFFSSPSGSGDSTLHGEARRYLGSREFTVPATSTPYTLLHTFIPAFAVAAGDVITATITLKTGASTFASTSEFSENISLAPLATSIITGRVFDHGNTLGSPGASVGLRGARVTLFLDDGDGVANVADNFIASKLTNATGDYSFTGLVGGTYWTVVDSRTIIGAFNAGADANSIWWEQTYGAADSLIYAGTAQSFNASSGLLIGGARREVSDSFDGTAISLSGAEHLVRSVVPAGTTTNSVDFGFASQVISTTLDGDDDGLSARTKQGSLRQFIQNSTALVGVQISEFRLGSTDANFDVGNGVWRFNIGTILPTLTDGTQLDGYTQAAWFGDTNSGTYLPPVDPLRPFSPFPISQPEIELVGSGTAALGPGLTLSGANGRVSGLAINGFDTGIYSSATGAVIQYNFIGTNALGLDTLTRRVTNGVRVETGTNSTVSRNLIGSTLQNGVAVNSTSGMTIAYNTITNTGLSGLQYDGVNVIGSNTGLVITGNSILFSNAFAIDVDIANAPQITGNFVADSGVGGAELGGIFIHSGVKAATIQSNVITRSHTAIWLQGDGIANVHQIGGVGLGNTLVGNQGIGIRLEATNGAKIQGNYIGVTSSLAPLANVGAGVFAAAPSSNTYIGGVNSGEGNVIANASGSNASGVLLLGNGYQTTILGNAVYQNGALGISLGANANTPAINDLNDADLTASTGPQNYPVISSAQTSGTTTLITGVLNSKAGRNYRLEVFRNPSSMVEANGFAEGAQYLGYFNVSTDALGQASFNRLLALATAVGDKLTLTATEDFGAGFASTSEFSLGMVVSSTTPAGITVSSPTVSTTDENGATSQFSVVLNSQPTADVTITLEVSNLAEAGISAPVLIFTPANWNIAQVVTVTGENDSVVDGNVAYSILIEPAVSADSVYNGLDAADVNLVNLNVDTTNTFYVTNSTDLSNGNVSSTAALLANDGGDGISLREAISAANNTANGSGGVDQIRFAIPSSVTQTIFINTALPTINEGVSIDGSSQMGFAGLPLIELRGNYTPGVNGLFLMPGSDGTTIRGLVINNFANNGIEILSNSNRIVGNFIGTNVAGTTALGNGATGITLSSANNTIGGTTAVDRNVISGNAGSGVFFYGAASNNNQILGNYIGTNAAGDRAIGNGGEGIVLVTGAHDNFIGQANGGGNVISGNAINGLGLNTSDRNIIQGNVIGLNAAGTAAIANGYSGISIGNSSFNEIGGAGLGQGNTISGNLQNGVYAANAAFTKISGNLIGRNLSNTVNTGNGGNGIFFDGTSTGSLIGGTVTGSGNVIAANGAGIATSTQTTVELTILGNRIYQNIGLGIDLNWDGVTANDIADSDTGPNGLLNFPVLFSAFSNGIDTTVTGIINSTPNTTLRVEFFRSVVGHVTNFGQAETYLGFTTVTTNVNGDASFYALLTGVSSPIGSAVSATATIANGATYGGSSEFAKNVLVSSAPPGVSVSAPSAVMTTEAGGTSQFSVVLNSPPSADVMITLSLSDASEASLSSTTLVFNASNWNVAQIVNVTGRDDTFVDGNVAYNVVTSSVNSADPAYNGFAVDDVALSNADNDVFNTIVVDTVSDAADGDTSSIAGLYANRGADGKVSLREAIAAANNTVNGSQRDSILFNIADPLVLGAHSINLLSSLPGITDAVFIDASSEPDFGANHVVELNGALAGAGASGIEIYGNGSQVSGLTINRFSRYGIYTTGAGHVLTNNFIGVDVNGSGTLSNLDFGVYSLGDGLAVQNNIISNSLLGGVYIGGQDTLVEQNYFSNQNSGVLIVDASLGVRVTNNSSNLVTNLIDLGNDGITPNDVGDADSGANNLQNTVSITSVLADTTSIRVIGGYNGEPSKTLAVDVYEHGTVGMNVRSRYVGSFVIVTDALGNASFNQVIAGAYAAGTIFSATATDVSSTMNQSTSEHSSSRVSTLAAPLSPEVIVNTGGTVVVNEGGASRSVSFVLSTAPTADVTVNFSVSAVGEVSLSATSFTFTSANWNIPQILTLTGLQDFVVDGDTTLTLVTSNAISADLDYSGLVVADFSISNQAIPNLAPTINAPVGYSAIEDVVASLGGAISGLFISDADAGNTTLSVTLSLSNGLVSLGSTVGLSFALGDGTADTSMTFTGTIAQINAAIDSLIFMPTANFNGRADLSISVNDLGNTGTGGALSKAKTVPINVVSANDAATFTGSKTALLNEGDSVLITPSMLQMIDIDTATSDLVYSLVSQTADGELKREGVLLRLGDSFTQADIDAGLISYIHLGGENPSASITFAMSERFGASLPEVVLSFDVMPINDAPVITDLVGGSVPEVTTVGTVVGSVGVIDPDNSIGAQFSLIDSSGGRFSIESSTGLISVANALLIDFETATQHSIRVKVTDQFGTSSERLFQIQVADMAEFIPTTPPSTTPSTTPPTTPPTADPTQPPTITTIGGTPTTGATITETLGTGTNGNNGPVSNPIVTFAEVARMNGTNILKQRQAEAEIAVWVDSVQETRASARKEINRRAISMMELELLDADGVVKQRRSLNLDSMDALFKARKNGTAAFAPANVVFYDFKLPSDAQAGVVDDGKIDASDNSKRFSVVIDSAEIGGVMLSVGVVAWVTRAGGLLAALMSALPAWKGLDPLLVLSPAKANVDKGFEDFSDTDLREDEEAVQAVLS
jgi:CSLREA domain-containing protein